MSKAQFDQAFSELTAKERETLFAMAEGRTFRSGESIIEEDTMPDAVYVITAGEVRVTRGISQTVSADFAGPLGLGELIGELSFIDGTPASATLLADGNVETLRLGHDDLNAMIATDPAIAGRLYHSLLKLLVHRLRVVNKRILLPFA